MEIIETSLKGSGETSMWSYKGAEIKRQRSLILGVVQVQCLTLDNQIRTVCDEAVVIDRFLLFLFVFCSLDFFKHSLKP